MSTQDPPNDNAPGELIWEGSPTWRSRIGHTLLCFLVMAIGAAAYLVMAIHEHSFSAPLALAMLGIVGAGLVMWLYQWIKLSAIKYRLTTKRIEWEIGIVSRTIDGIDVARVRHVEYHQSFGDRLGGVSRLHVYVQDQEDPEITVIGLPARREIYDKIAQAAQIGRRGTFQIVQ